MVAQKRKPKDTAPTKRRRLTPEVRRASIMDAAAELIAKQGFLPLSIEALAQLAGTSKALIYAYFPTQYDLFNALLEREIAELANAGVETASRVDDLEQAAVLSAMLYFERIAQSGPLLHILLTDLYMAGHIDSKSTESGNAMLQRLIRLARTSLKLSRKEILAAIEMIAAVPEEAGSLAFHKELDASVAREICHTLMLSSLQALRSPGRVTVSPDNAA